MCVCVFSLAARYVGLLFVQFVNCPSLGKQVMNPHNNNTSLRPSSPFPPLPFQTQTQIQQHALLGPPAITCGELTDPLVVFSGSCDGDYGDTCVYSQCIGGHLMAGGDATRVCGESGWSGTAPVCERSFVVCSQ